MGSCTQCEVCVKRFVVGAFEPLFPSILIDWSVHTGFVLLRPTVFTWPICMVTNNRTLLLLKTARHPSVYVHLSQ